MLHREEIVYQNLEIAWTIQNIGTQYIQGDRIGAEVLDAYNMVGLAGDKGSFTEEQ